MTPNKQTVAAYMEGFRRNDHAMVLSCLTDDVTWEIPGAFQVRGKPAFERHIVDEGFVASPAITVSRMTEEADVVIAEGSVETRRTDGTMLTLMFCDVFELRDAKVRRLVSYLVPLGGS